MAIHLNLLAEYLAAEDARRRDPVKRTVWLAALGVGAVLVWSGWAQLGVMNAQNELYNLDSKWNSLEKNSAKVATNLAVSSRLEANLASLQRLSAARHLWGNTFNALQFVDPQGSIQVTKLSASQDCVISEGTKVATPGKPAKPASATEKVILTLSARDLAQASQEYYLRFMKDLAAYPYFGAHLASNGVSLVTIASDGDPDNPARVFTTFTIDCRFADQVREAK